MKASHCWAAALAPRADVGSLWQQLSSVRLSDGLFPMCHAIRACTTLGKISTLLFFLTCTDKLYWYHTVTLKGKSHKSCKHANKLPKLKKNKSWNIKTKAEAHKQKLTCMESWHLHTNAVTKVKFDEPRPHKDEPNPKILNQTGVSNPNPYKSGVLGTFFKLNFRVKWSQKAVRAGPLSHFLKQWRHSASVAYVMLNLLTSSWI